MTTSPHSPQRKPLFQRARGKVATETLWAWGLLAPCFIGLLIFTYIPIVASLGLSFSYWNLLGTPEWVGLANYQSVLADPLFWQSFKVTWLFVLITAIAEVSLALALAVFLQRLAKPLWQTLFRTLYFLPVITPMVSVALVFGWLYDPAYGLLNSWLQSLQVIKTPIAWLYDPNTALWAVAALRVWKGVGYTMILFLAALQGISPSLHESATLDGASAWQTFWKITLPMITPTLFFVSIMAIINGFQVFDAIYLLTQGGPEHATELLVYWMFKNAFEFYKVGPASAIAYLLFVMILGLTLLQWQLRKRWVLYEDEVS